MWVSAAAAVVNHGAIPVLADIDDTFCLDRADVQKRITRMTTGNILVHMSGAPGNAKAIQIIARDSGLFLVEDCAKCAGGSVDGQKVRTFGDMGTLSLQRTKNMTARKGRCVVRHNLRPDR